MRYEVKQTTFKTVFDLWRLLKALDLMTDDIMRKSWSDMQALQTRAHANNLKISNTRLWVDIG